MAREPVVKVTSDVTGKEIDEKDKELVQIRITFQNDSSKSRIIYVADALASDRFEGTVGDLIKKAKEEGKRGAAPGKKRGPRRKPETT